jgi:hypothetical protein
MEMHKNTRNKIRNVGKRNIISEQMKNKLETPPRPLLRTCGGTILGLEPKVLQVSPSTPIHSKRIQVCNIHIC